MEIGWTADQLAEGLAKTESQLQNVEMWKKQELESLEKIAVEAREAVEDEYAGSERLWCHIQLVRNSVNELDKYEQYLSFYRQYKKSIEAVINAEDGPRKNALLEQLNNQKFPETGLVHYVPVASDASELKKQLRESLLGIEKFEKL